jgi:hypothetical protein
MRSFFNYFPVLLFLITVTVTAQIEEESQAYWIHEDPVYPSMVLDYEETCKELVLNCEKFNIQEANWVTISTDDLKYFFISAIEKMGDLDKSRFANLQENMEKDEFNNIFDTFDNCYDTHYDYIIHLDHELSYKPDGTHLFQEDMSYRKMEYYYITPQNFNKVIGILKEFKTLYSNKQSKEHYTIFRSGFGSEGDYIMVLFSAKSPEAFERTREESNGKLGPEREVLYKKLLGITNRVETLNGFFRLDLSYIPK